MTPYDYDLTYVAWKQNACKGLTQGFWLDRIVTPREGVNLLLPPTLTTRGDYETPTKRQGAHEATQEQKRICSRTPRKKIPSANCKDEEEAV